MAKMPPDRMQADPLSEEGLDSIFGYHKPKNQETNLAHDEVRATCKDAARTFIKILPHCPEKILAIRKLQEAMFFANSAVAQHGIPDAWPPFK